MKGLPYSKVENVIKRYMRGNSYSEIARQEGVSKGSVANVVADLRAGKFPEFAGAAEEVEMFRDLGAGLRQHSLTLGQASSGVAIVNGLNDLGINLSDVQRWVSLCKELSQGDADPGGFMAAALQFHTETEQTGLTYQELADKAESLRGEVATLEPTVAKLRAEQQALDKAQREGIQLRRQAAREEQRLADLRQQIQTTERREEALASRVASLEERAHEADVRLTTARKNMESLAKMGLTLEDLTGFVARLHGVAQRHGIGQNDLKRRLFKELEALDEGLTLESLIDKLRQQAQDEETHLASTREQRAAAEAAVQDLKAEQAAIQASIQRGTDLVGTALRTLADGLISQGVGFRQAMGEVLDDSLADAFKLEEQLFALGEEVGRYEGILEANRWLAALTDLLHGGDPDPRVARAALLAILRATGDWVRRSGIRMSQASLGVHLGSLITALEGWQP